VWVKVRDFEAIGDSECRLVSARREVT